MLGLSKILGIPKPFCAKALLSGAMAVRRHTAAVEKQGKALLATLRPDDKVLVLITRNYGVSDPILNMGIPELLLERGYKVITLSHLPGHALDISDEYDNLKIRRAAYPVRSKADCSPPEPLRCLPDEPRLRPGHHALPPVQAGDGR